MSVATCTVRHVVCIYKIFTQRCPVRPVNTARKLTVSLYSQGQVQEHSKTWSDEWNDVNNQARQ